MSYMSEVLADAPWAFWELPETSGSTLADSSGNGRDLTISGSPTLAQTGPFGTAKAVLFSTSTPYAGTTATFAQSTVTLDCWVYLSATPSTDTTLIGMAQSYHSGVYDKNLWIASDGKVYWYVFDGAVRTLVSSSTVPIGSWFHLAASVGPAGQEIRVGGVLDGSSSTVTSSYTGTQQVFVHGSGFNGNRPTGDGGPVTIAYPAVYTTQLTGARIAAHAAATSTSGTDATVTPPAATGTGSAPTPAVESVTAVSAPAATGAGSAVAPTVSAYTDLTLWTADTTQQSSLPFTGGAILSMDVPVADPAPDAKWERVSTIYDAPTVVDGFPVDWMPSGPDEIEDLGQLQVVVGGRDLSTFRGKRTQVGDWSSMEAGGDSTCSIRFPAITPWDHAGTGETAWLKNGVHVELRQVPPTGPSKLLWAGRYMSNRSTLDRTGWGFTLQCQGVCFGADNAALPATLRNDERDIGDVVRDVMNSVVSRAYATMARVVTGIKTRARGPAPQRLQFLAQIFATATTEDGLDQWTLDNVGWRPIMKLKDRSTVHATMRVGQPGLQYDLGADISQHPKVIIGEGTRADGMRFRNMIFPGARLTDPPLFPLDPSDHFTPGGSDTGFAPFAQEMRDHGYTMYSGDTYDSRDETEVRFAQSRGGIDPINGHVGADTWAVVLGVGGSTADLNGAYQAPMAIIREVDPYTYNARGEITGPNPHYDPSIPRIERYEDFGEGSSLALARSSARGELNRTNVPKILGTVTLTKDPNEISRFFLRAGMNLLLQDYYQIDRLLHIAGVEVDWKNGSVRLTVDELNRDLITLQQIRQRNRESSTSPLRRVTTSRSQQIIDTYTIWDGEAPTGRIWQHAAPGGRWVVIRMASGQSGTIARLSMLTSSPAREYAVGVFGRPVTAAQLNRLVGSPFDEDRPWDASEAALEDLGIQAAWGGQENPAGYSPKAKTDDGAVLNGKLKDTGGFGYASDYPGWLWVAYYVAGDCLIEGRMVPGVEGL